MTQTKCIKIIRDSNNIIKTFVLSDENDNIKEYGPLDLKIAIRSGRINVVNLKLNNTELTDEDRLKLYIRNAIALGSDRLTELTSTSGEHCYLLQRSEKEYELYIPDNVVTCSEIKPQAKGRYADIKGTVLTVHGGRNLRYVHNMFNMCTFDKIIIDMPEHKITDANSMFNYNYASEIIFKNFNTSNIWRMRNMFFNNAELKSLDLSNFDTHNVKDMKNMFHYCSNLKKLNLSSFDTSKSCNKPGADYENMFVGCESLKSLECTDKVILETNKKELYRYGAIKTYE